MAEYQEVFPDHQELFTNLIAGIDSLNSVNIKVLGNNELKQVTKTIKANDLLRHESANDVYIILNETIFEPLNEEQKAMVVEEAVAQIYFDVEKDKISIIKPDFTTFSGLLVKYGHQKCLDLQALIKLMYESQGDR
jgi:hypothetical protein